MANRLQLRHGSTVPTTSNLLSYELGWDGTHHILYINNNGTIKKVGGEGSFLPLTGGAITGAINRYYTTTSTDPIITLRANNVDAPLFQMGHATSASGTISNYYKLVYKGTGALPNNYLQLVAYKNAEVIAMQVDENGNVGFTNTVTANISGSATQDGNGDTISSTYLKLTGGTLSGDLTITKAGEVNIYANNTTQGHNISLCAGGSGKGGIYDNTNSKWIVYAESGGTVVLNGGANQIITKGTVGTRSVYVTTSASVPSGAVAGDIVLVKV